MRAVFASLLFFCLAPAVAQTPPASSQTPPAASPLSPKQVKELGEHLYTNSGATGMVLVVVRGHQVSFHGYGETATASRQLPTEDSVIRLCSLTKTFTTDLLAKLAADHTVKLNDTLQHFAPPEGVVPQRDKPITLAELATHTAGLQREVGTGPRGTPHFTYPDYATRWQWLETAHLLYTPGTQALYSNVGFDLLADALANAAHKPYPALLSARTLQPLGMWHTTFFPSPAQCAQLLNGWHNEGPCTNTENTMGSSGLYSTPADMARWLEYLLNQDTSSKSPQPPTAQDVYVAPARLVRQTGLSHAGEPSGIGLAWLHLAADNSPDHIIEKTGGGAGFVTYIAIHPASQTALFLAMTDGPPGRGTPGFNLFKAANNALLQLAGLPPSQQEIEFHRRARQVRHTAHHARSRHAAPSHPTAHTARHASPTHHSRTRGPRNRASHKKPSTTSSGSGY